MNAHTNQMDNMCFEACPTKITNYAFLRKMQFNAKQLFGIETRYFSIFEQLIDMNELCLHITKYNDEFCIHNFTQ